MDPYYEEWRAKMAHEGLNIMDVGIGDKLMEVLTPELTGQLAQIIPLLPKDTYNVLRIRQGEETMLVIIAHMLLDGQVELGLPDEFPAEIVQALREKGMPVDG